MTSSNELGDPAEKLQSLADLFGKFEAASPAEQSAELANLIVPRIDKVRLFKDKEHRRMLVREIAVSTWRRDNEGPGFLPSLPLPLWSEFKRLADRIDSIFLALDVIFDAKSGAVSLAVETEPALEGQALSTAAAMPKSETGPQFDDVPFGDEYWKAEEAAKALDAAKSTVTRKINANEIIGFRLFKNLLYIPKEQFEGMRPISGIPKVIAMFDGDHKEAWNFLTANLFYGSESPRPLDRLRKARGATELKNCLDELRAAKDSFDRGDYF